jgi:transcription initiation factor TFIID subunit 2
VDDGSHDILQEVLAIEREKERRQRTQLEKERSTTIVTGQRKKGGIDEDEILQLATPAKKERSSPPDSSAGKLQTIPPSTNSRPTVPPIKVKKEKPVELLRSAGNHSPVPSLKGKEKEVSPPDNHAKQSKQRKAAPGTPINEKKCKDLLKTLLRVPESLIFRQPVDPIRDGCPT